VEDSNIAEIAEGGEIFTVLVGDQVEPRMEIVETTELNAMDLDM
jgi:DNA gyrase/topoisomerase IV subunit B